MSGPDYTLPESTGTMTVSEVTGLVNLFNSQLALMEGRLVNKMDDNSRLASERWVKHDAELDKNTKRIVARFESIEGSILVIERTLNDHLDKEHDDEVAMEARVRPVKSVAGWFWRNWRDLLLLFIGLVAAGTFFLDWLTHVFTPS